MIIRHVVTKKLETGWRRLVFECVNDTDQDFVGEFFLELKAILGAVYNAHQMVQIKKGECRRFTVDLDEKHAGRWSKFKYTFSNGTIIETQKGKKVERYENLTDVVIQHKIDINKQLNILRWW